MKQVQKNLNYHKRFKKCSICIEDKKYFNEFVIKIIVKCKRMSFNCIVKTIPLAKGKQNQFFNETILLLISLIVHCIIV